MEEQGLNSLINMAKNTGAGEGHILLHHVQKQKGLTAVISVYDNVKPSHIILDELEEWAEKNGKQDVLDKIYQLAEDKSWREED